ncbi:MAG TPA: polysaccharide deacetylase family protein [Bacteroidota bacterium]|nr:polysaccharide deacetylase family protein [Bacteroidota bacterium]
MEGNVRERGTLLFFWDYDAEWGAERSRGPGGPKAWGPLEFPNTDELLDLHARYAIPACFAVVGAAALPGARPYQDPAQVRRIHDSGHEVASHSFRHDWLPGLSGAALLGTLRESRHALEQCIGAAVRTFVPPYNQPFDYPRGLSFSLAERREVPRARTDLRSLCDALGEAGYGFCRVAYRPLWQRAGERAMSRRLDRPSRLEKIGPVTCVRLNTPGGFGPEAEAMVRRCAAEGGIGVIYGHPHSIHTGNAQDMRLLLPMMGLIREMRDRMGLRVALPRELPGEA